jgi:hypothetical protein
MLSHNLPRIGISPYSISADIINIDQLSKEISLSARLMETIPTKSGRAAIDITLSYINKTKRIKKVLVLTSSNTEYLSGCVSNVVTKYGVITRDINDIYDCVLVIHELGQLNSSVLTKKFDVPVIHDFAYGFHHIQNIEISNIDYIVLSYSKFFDIGYGGMVIKINPKGSINFTDNLGNLCDDILKKRMKVKTLIEDRLSEINIILRSKNTLDVLLFKIDSISGVNILKKSLSNFHIESSAQYYSNEYFIPCHQNIREQHVEQIVHAFKIAKTKHEFQF